MDKIRTTLVTLLTIITSLTFSQQKSGNETIAKPLGDEAFGAILEFFKYDKSTPLDTRVIDVQDRGNCKLETFVVTSSNRTRVPGVLAIPKLVKPKYPCMILLHGGAGSKEDWWSNESRIMGLALVNELLDAGYAVMAIDADAHGGRAINNDFSSFRRMWFEQKLVYTITEIVVQSAIDNKRAIDYLRTRNEIDSTRIGVIGYSMGGIIATYLCTQIQQLKTAVICSGGLYAKEISPSVQPLHFAPRITNVPILLLHGRKDPICPESQARELERLIKSAKKNLILYDSGHVLPKEYLKDAFEWIKMNL